MTDYTIVNSSVGHGIALVRGEDEAAVEALATRISEAMPAVSPANRGLTNGEPEGSNDERFTDTLTTKGGVNVTLFASATDDEAATVRKVVG